jgi:8-oxo-dGTP pyrophosphatase MutT (NUDIX family)
MAFSTLRLGGALVALSQGANQNWKTQLIYKDGSQEDVTDRIAGVVSVHQGINTTVAYGISPPPFGQYDQWVITQGDTDGIKGGSSVIPWVRHHNGQLYILVVEEDRHLISLEHKTWGPPGGFLQRDESHEKGAIRETDEETGLEIGNRSIELLPGAGVCFNRTFFDVLPTQQMGSQGNGDYFYTRELPASLFRKDENGIWRIDPQQAQFTGIATSFIKVNRQGEFATRLVPLFPLDQLLGAVDGVLIIAVARLLSYLAQKGEIVLSDAQSVNM